MSRLHIVEPPDDGTILQRFDEQVSRGALDDVGQVIRIDVIEYDPGARQSLVEIVLQRWVDWP